MSSPLESRLQDAQLLQTRAFVDGRWQEGEHGRFAVTDPATGAHLADVADVSVAQVQQAIAAAQAAWPDWRERSAHERSALLMRWHALLMQHQHDLACLMTAEQGKPLAEARGEVAYGASFVQWFAEQARRVAGEVLAAPGKGQRLFVLRQPVGVCAAITPWNFPLAMITRKVAPALAAGCPVVIKPAELTPLTALAVAELARRAGLPAGVLNVITGTRSSEYGQALCASPVVRHLSFTGSTEVGRILMAQCAPTVKKLALELGGNAPFIVFDDADIPAAVQGAFASKFRNAGQTCVCANRFYVQAGVYDEFVRQFTARVQAARVGNGFDEGVEIGPLIEPAALQKVQQHVADALAHGGRIVTGGHALPALGSGQFHEATVIAHASAEMLCTREETFGPLAPIVRFETEAQAIAAANASEYGLAAYFYSQNPARIWRVAEALESGMVGVNTGLISNEVAPFGGVKQSGLGREGSVHGIDEYLEMKYVCQGALA